MIKKISKFILLFVICLTLFIFGIACGGDNSSTSTGKNKILVENYQQEYIVEVGDQFTTSFAYVVDGNDDRVDGKVVTTQIINTHNDVIQESTEVITFMFITSGTYKVVYSVDGAEDVVTTVNVCKKLSAPTDFKLVGNTLSWESIGGAIGYKVKFNNDEWKTLTSTSFTDSRLNGIGYCIQIISLGDYKKTTDSLVGSFMNRTSLKTGELAAFNDFCYVFDITEALPVNLNAFPSNIEYLTEADCIGSTDGALKMSIQSGSYGTGLFRLELVNNLDMNEEFGGLEFRFKVDSEDYSKTNVTQFRFVNPNSDDYRATLTIDSSMNDQWLIMKIPKEKLPSTNTGGYNLGYSYDHLQFNLYDLVRTTGKGDLYLDYVHQYNEVLQTPSNLEINGNDLTFDGVDHADGYEAYVTYEDNGKLFVKTIRFTGTSFDLSDYEGKSYIIKICAYSNNALYGTSEYSEVVSRRKALPENSLAEFDDLFYKGDIVNYSVIVDKALYNIGNVIKNDLYDNKVEGENYVSIKLSNDNNKNSAFKVLLTKPLDLTNNDGIIVRFMIESTNYEFIDDIGLQLVGSTSDAENYTTYDYRKVAEVGSWATLQLTSEEVGKYYTDGDKELCFVVRNAKKNTVETYATVLLNLDYIRYYKNIDKPTDLKIEGNNLVWDSVTNAGGYIVKINGVETTVNQNQMDITSYLSSDFYATVKALPGDEIYGESEYSDVFTQKVIPTGKVATFNSLAYEKDVVAGTSNEKVNVSFVSAGSCDGSDGGALDITSKTADYRSSFIKILLQDALDFTGYDGINIRFKLYYANYPDGYSFKIGLADKTAKNIISEKEIVFGEWETFSISKSDIISNYDSTDKFIILRIRNGASPSQDNCSVKLYLDDISYCLSIDKPTNLKIEGNNLVWDAVTNAGGYKVSINGVETTVNQNQIDITSYLSNDFYATVKALPSSGSYVESEYSEVFTKKVLSNGKIATFNSLAYEKDVVAGTSNEKVNVSFVSAGSCDGSDGGALDITSKTADYRSSFIKILLQDALDFTGYDGINIRFKLYYANYPDGYSFKIGLADKTAKNIISEKEIVFGEWETFSISKSDIISNYDSTDKFIILRIRNGASPSQDNCSVKLYLDDISYFVATRELEDGELANFNTVKYVGDIENINNTEKFAVSFLSEDTCEGSNGGAVSVTVKGNSYRTTEVKINLENSLALSTNDYINIRFKVYSNPYADASSFKMRLVSSNYTSIAEKEFTVGEWTVLTVNCPEMLSYYSNSDSYLILQTYKGGTSQDNLVVKYYIDDISYAND